jgi:AcrR family transcriptional regulator
MGENMKRAVKDLKKKRQTRANIDLARRAEIAVEKRQRTRAGILIASFRIVGEERGSFKRVEDFCVAANISRGTFYNYFTGLESLYSTLADELSQDFDAAVHSVMEGMNQAAARASAAVRYYLRGAMDNPRWGWAMVHTSLGREVFGPEVSTRAKRTIQEGIESREFRIDNAELGKALLLGASLSGTLDILYRRAAPDYPERMAHHILLGLGVDRAIADAVIKKRLPTLVPIAGENGASPVNFWADLG